jgi:hypothetical protein
VNKARIDRFFKLLSEECPENLRVILTGAAAGALLGHVRASVDVDFAIRSARKDPEAWDRVRAAVARVTEKTGVSANFAQDIDRWSQITYLDYDRHVIPYKRFGALKAEVLEPGHWSIGKMARFLAPDVRDMVQVFRKRRVPARLLVRLWGKALKNSPPSDAQFLFRKNVESFLSAHGRKIWGKDFDAPAATALFHGAAGLKIRKPNGRRGVS